MNETTTKTSSKSYVADFETTTKLDDCRVWCFSISEIGNIDNTIVGLTIEDFFDELLKLGSCTIYFHNLRFDSQFILSYMLTSGYEYTDDGKRMKDKSFTTLISGLGVFYAIEVKLAKGVRIKFLDSYKKINTPVEKIPKDFDLPINKLEIDYNMDRPVGYQLTDEEREYVQHDTKIVAMALKKQFDKGLDKMTIAGDALASVKALTDFNNLFPVLPREIDDYIRKSYRGGWCYVNPEYQNKDLGQMFVYDVNSLYPSRMRYCLLPYGEPKYFSGKYKEDGEYPLYICHIKATFKLKNGCFPCIQDKHNRIFSSTEYIREHLDGLEPLEIYLTSVDFKLFCDMYDIYTIDYIDGYKFKAKYDMFNSYIDYWNSIKIKATEEGNKSMRTIAKLMLNSCYGKFASSTRTSSKIPYLKEDGIVGYITREDEPRDPIYTALSCFITAWARDLTIRSAVACSDIFAYADTDSLHILDKGIVPDIPIDNFKLGYFKLESKPRRARFLRAKTYIEEIYNDKSGTLELEVKCAGMNPQVKEYVTWDNFHYGFTSDLKLKPKNVKGGVVLVNTPFTISEPK